MGRRRAVEGLTLDLTRIEEGTVFTLEEVVVDANQQKRVYKKKQKRTSGKKPVVMMEDSCVSCGVVRRFDISGDKTCYMCKSLQNVSDEIVKYIREAYKGPCTLCGDHATMYHYDHINMFDKRASILSLVHESIDAIAAEIVKCQLVCIPCHRVITATEARMGYLKKKLQLMKSIRAGKDVSILREKYANEYERDFAEVYAALRLHGK